MRASINGSSGVYCVVSWDNAPQPIKHIAVDPDHGYVGMEGRGAGKWPVVVALGIDIHVYLQPPQKKQNCRAWMHRRKWLEQGTVDANQITVHVFSTALSIHVHVY